MDIEIKKKTKSLRAENIELHAREVSVSTDSTSIYLRGSDNLYPVTMENVVNSSPTGKRCSNLMAKYIIGKGIEDHGKTVINRKGETLNQLAKRASKDISKQYGVYFHIAYGAAAVVDGNATFNITDVKVLDYVVMALSKEDDDENAGKVYMLKEGQMTGSRVKPQTWYYPFNTNTEVIRAQMIKDCEAKGIKDPGVVDMIKHHRGQVFYLNLTPEYHYALPVWDVVYDDMDSEYRIARYTNTQTRTGWLGKTIVKRFADDQEEDERATDSFKKVIKDNMGAENASNTLVIDIPPYVDDVNKAFVIDQLKAQYDDKLFDATIKNLRQNIMGAFNNVPEALVYAGQGALFGTSADTYAEMKKFYWEQNEWERQELEAALSLFTGLDINFIPIVDETTTDIDDDEGIRKKSQAALKGSVGGVTALLEIQKSVAAGATDINAGVEIIKEIFGINEDVARRMLGTPKKIEGDDVQ